jgi:D-sedoheptulose 7-phosphate isomerase
MSAADFLTQRLHLSLNAKQELLAQPETLATFDAAVTELIARYRRGGRLYIAGNGGSAADAQHLATEFVSRLQRDRAPLPAEALTVDTSALTAIANDYGFEYVFSRQLEAKARPEDMLLAITTSGRSANILRVLQTARTQGIPSLLFTGHQGGEARTLADFCVIAPGADTNTIQEIHIVLAHALCGAVEAALFPAGA